MEWVTGNMSLCICVVSLVFAVSSRLLLSKSEKNRTLVKSACQKIIFLFLNQIICCWYSKEPSQWDGSFEHPKHMLKLMGKKYLNFYAEVFCLSKPVNEPRVTVIASIWDNSWDFGTYHACEKWRLRWVCKKVQSRQSFQYTVTHTESRDINEGSDILPL